MNCDTVTWPEAFQNIAGGTLGVILLIAFFWWISKMVN